MTDERGGVTTELAVLTPVLVLLMLFVVLSGRLGQADQDVTQAAAEAARVVSLTRGSVDRAALAARTAAGNLAASGVRCGDLDVATDTGDLRPGGSVRVDVRCDVDLRGLSALGVADGRVVTATAVEVIDTYRGGD